MFAAVGGGNHQHRHRVGIGLAHGRQNIGHAGAGNDETHARLATGAGVAVGHKPGALLMARADMPQTAAMQAAIELDGVHTGDAEHGIYPITFQQANQGLGTGGHCSFPSYCSVSIGRTLGGAPRADKQKICRPLAKKIHGLPRTTARHPAATSPTRQTPAPPGARLSGDRPPGNNHGWIRSRSRTAAPASPWPGPRR